MNATAMIGGVLLSLLLGGARAQEASTAPSLSVGTASVITVPTLRSVSFVLSAGNGSRITIRPDGNVVLSEGLKLDEASQLFWRRVQDVGLRLACESGSAK